jgi:hypothetical protein
VNHTPTLLYSPDIIDSSDIIARAGGAAENRAMDLMS